MISREGLILTLSILPSGGIGKSIRPQDFPRLSISPSGFSLRKSLGSQEISLGWISQYLPHFSGAQIHPCSVFDG